MKIILIILAIILSSCSYRFEFERSKLTDKKYLSEKINYYSDKFNLSPVLIEGIIIHESRTNRLRISKSKAYGLMQVQVPAAMDGLNYAEYYELAKEIKKDPNLLLQIDINLLAGCSYLRWILDKKNPKHYLGMMGRYNSGSEEIIVGWYGTAIYNYCSTNQSITVEEMFKRMR